jgi:hypothetical protein
MRAQAILAFALFLAVCATAEEAPNPLGRAECSFSDGSRIMVTYSDERKSYRFVTDGSLVTVNGVRVPAGDYAASPVKDSDNNWTLNMSKRIMEKGSSVLPPLPMSVATPVSAVEDFPISFYQTGGSCTMYWRQKNSGTPLSIEFTKENADQRLRRLTKVTHLPPH